MAGESLRELGERLQTAAVAAVNAPGMRATLEICDLTRIIEIVKRYGGRRGWAPTPGAVDQLAPSVRRYVRMLEDQVAELRGRR